MSFDEITEKTIILPSMSKLKQTAIKRVFGELQNIQQIQTETICEQPLGIQNTIEICKNRIQQVLNMKQQLKNWDNCDFIISIENGINLDTVTPMDFVVCGLYSIKLNRIYIESGGINLKNISNCLIIKDSNSKINEYYDLLEKVNSKTTFGSLIHNQNNEIPANNWMESLCNLSRVEQISIILRRHSGMMQLISNFQTYNNFPREGIIFNDIIGLCSKWQYMKIIINKITSHLNNEELTYDYIVGLDARGFILGGMLASILKIGFIPIRKKGKLPGKCFKVVYTKEYGEDVFEIQQTAIPEKSVNILIIDDILTTGGTAKAALHLVRKFPGVKHIKFIFLDKIDGFNVDLKENSQYILLNEYENID